MKEPVEGDREAWKSWLKTQHSKNEDHEIHSQNFMANRWGKMEVVRDFTFLGSKITADSDCNHEIKRQLIPGRKAMTPRQCIKKQRYHFADKGPSSQSYSFSSKIQMWELDLKAGWGTEELMLFNCGAGEASWVSLGLQGDQTSLS